jgi:hypothetical protein
VDDAVLLQDQAVQKHQQVRNIITCRIDMSAGLCRTS